MGLGWASAQKRSGKACLATHVGGEITGSEYRLGQREKGGELVVSHDLQALAIQKGGRACGSPPKTLT